MRSVSPPAWSLLPPLSSLIIPVSLLILGASLAEAQISSDINYYLQYTDGLKTMWTESLKSLYQLSQNFILTITGKGLSETVLKEFGINISDPTTFSKAKIVVNNTNEFAQKVVREGTGYIVVVSIGVLLTLFFSASACCLICCRKIGGCCGKVGDNEPKSFDVPLTVVLFVVVVSVSGLLFLSAYGTIVSGVTAVDSLKKDEESGFPFVGNIFPAIRGIPVFLNRTIEDISVMFNVSKFMIQFQNVTGRLSMFMQNHLKAMGNDCLSCGELIDDYQLLRSYGENLTKALEDFDKTQTSLDWKYISLNLTLEEFKDKTLNASENCPSNNMSCMSLREAVKKLKVLRPIPFGNISNMTNLLKELEMFDLTLFGVFPELVSSINNISRSILDTLRGQLDNFIVTLRSSDVFQFDKKYLSRNASIFSGLNWDQVNQISNIVVIALKVLAIVIGSIFFVVILLNIIGLILGPTCIKRNPKASEKVFVASSQISLIGGAAFCILAMILFIFGTLAYREGCYDFRKEEGSLYFLSFDKFIQLKLKELNLNNLDVTENVTVKVNLDKVLLITKTIMKDCKNNGTLTNIFFEVVVVDNSTLDGILKQFGPLLDNLKTKKFSELPTFSNDIIIILRNTSQYLDILSNDTFSEFNETLLQYLFLPPLDYITFLMNETLYDGSLVNTTTILELIQVDAPQINETNRNITSEEEMLVAQLKEIQGMTGSISHLLLKMANASLNGRAELGNMTTDNLLRDLNSELKNIFWDLYNYIKAKFLGIGSCREVYLVFNLLFYFFCDLVINPLNAYWFSLGISIVLLIPSFLAGLWLGGLFARRHKTLEDLEGSEGDDAEFIDPKGGNYMTAEHVTGNVKVHKKKISVMPTGLADLPGAGDASSPAKAPQKTFPIPAFPLKRSDGDLENASLYYIPPFPKSQPLSSNYSNYSNYASQDPYYNMPYFRVPQGYPGRPNSRFDVRIPRPWSPQSSGFSPYYRF